MKNEIHGRCGLHGETADLHDSHVLPRWAWKRAKESPTGRVVALKNNSVMLDERQLSEHLLCFECEQKLGVWDGYAAEVSRKDEGFVALNSVTPVPGLGDGDGQGADASRLDIEALSKFGSAVFLRASICSKLPYVSLGKYEDEFRHYLLDKASFPRSARLILQLLRAGPGEPIDQTFAFCGSRRERGFHVHSFVLFGLWYTMFVGQNLPPGAEQLCLARTSRVLVGFSEAILLGIGGSMVTATRKGKLARMPM